MTSATTTTLRAAPSFGAPAIAITVPPGIGIRPTTSGTISISASGNLTLSESPPRVVYPISNEWPDPEIQTILSKPLGITTYFGVAGGTTQNLDHTAKLLQNNPLRRIVLFDKDPVQLLNARDVIAIFNENDDEGYERAIEDHKAKGICRDKPPRWAKPQIETAIKIRLELAEASEFIRDIKEPGASFIYLSNILTWAHLTGPVSRAVRGTVGRIRANKNILEGSMVYIYLHNRDRTGDPHVLLLRKSHGELFTITPELWVSGPVTDSQIASLV